MVNRSNRAGGATRRMLFSPKQCWALSIISALLVVAAFRPAAAVTASPPQKKKTSNDACGACGLASCPKSGGRAGKNYFIFYFISFRNLSKRDETKYCK